MARSRNGSRASGEAGASRIGCLLGLVLGALVIIVGFQVIRQEFAYRSYLDKFEEQYRFRSDRSDEEMRDNLLKEANDLDLPKSAKNIDIEHYGTTGLVLSASYADTIHLSRWEWVRQRRIRVGSP